MDSSALIHMNEDHADSLLDYARYYGGADYAVSRAQLTPNTKQTSMEIAYRSGVDGKTKLTTVPLTLREGVSLRQRLIEMATEASVTRIPPFEPLPRPGLSLFLVANLVILGVVAHVPREALADAAPPLLWGAALAALDVLGGEKAGRRIFYAALVAHAGEGLFLAAKLLGAKKARNGRGNARIAAWVLQTIVVGFPSLTLALGRLQQAQEANAVKVD